ncbi:MAG: antitoxin Xre/MbcA/ParS toxin-binding domain-containing protein [Bradymonadaceae bacterium]
MSTAPFIENILDIELDGAMEAHIREGFSYRAILALQEFLQVTQGELAGALGVSRQTLIRHTKQKKARLTPQLSDQLFRVARIARRAVDVLGGQPNAIEWLKSPNAALGQRSPLSLLDTDAGSEKVDDVLGRIEYGVYS